MTQNEAYSTSRFYVMIDNMAQALFTEVSGLQVETEVMEYAEGGNNGFIHRLPGRTKVSNLTLKSGMTSSNELFKWYMKIARGIIDRRNISLVMYDTQSKEVTRWNFIKAYPVKWVGPSFAVEGERNAVETLELAHGGMQLG
jgi:phage tail-like protein